MSYSIERYHDFSCGHRVYGHESKCAHLHGHNYRVTFTCVPSAKQIEVTTMEDREPRYVSGRPGKLDQLGRVIDFSVVKAKLCEWLEERWDHRFLIWQDDPDAASLVKLDPAGVVLVPFNPTAEHMAAYLVQIVGPIALKGTGVTLQRCKVEETRKCSATFTL